MLPGDAFIAVPISQCLAILRDGYRVTKRRTLPAAKSVEEALYAYYRYRRPEEACVLVITSIPSGVGFMHWCEGFKIFTTHLEGSNLTQRALLPVSPASIRYNQDSISRRFRDGKLIHETAQQLAHGQVNANAIPPILIFAHEGALYTANNRRLWSFKQAGVGAVQVMLARSAAHTTQHRLTTRNGGASVVVR
jgi:hypothetical protein